NLTRPAGKNARPHPAPRGLNRRTKRTFRQHLPKTDRPPSGGRPLVATAPQHAGKWRRWHDDGHADPAGAQLQGFGLSSLIVLNGCCLHPTVSASGFSPCNRGATRLPSSSIELTARSCGSAATLIWNVMREIPPNAL